MGYAIKEFDDTISRLNQLWNQLKAASDADGEVPCDTPLCEEFIEVCLQTRALTDDLVEQRDSKSGG